MIFQRSIQKTIEKKFYNKKAIIIYGARQVGKTTLIKEIQKKYKENTIYLNCDEPDIRYELTNKTSTQIKEFIGNNKIILLDEAQRIKNIGITLKLIVDNSPADIQVIATGSSSFELSNEIIEPLTGQKYEFFLFPLSIEELNAHYSNIEIKRIIENRIIFGMYPEVVVKKEEKEEIINNIAESYLYKDILSFNKIKHSDALQKLLQALALQIGSEVSYNELASFVGLDKKTVDTYIQILEKAFIIFRLNPFSRNLRNELKKLRKIYFYDTGIRNAIIKNFNPMHLRQDIGALWENFIISERIKYNINNNISKNYYFWRNHQKKEIDFIEVSKGQIHGFEIKWGKKKYKVPEIFIDTYKDSTVNIITKDNYINFLK